MSKKNNLEIRRRQREHDLQREREEEKKKAEKAAKKAQALAVKGIEKKEKKNKTFRIRKGVRVKGIVVTDAESKRKAREVLAKAGVSMGMDIDGHAAAEARAAAKKQLIKTAGGVSRKAVKVKKIKAVVPTKPHSSSKSAAAAAKSDATEPAQMEVE